MLHPGLRFHEFTNDPIWGEIPLTEVEWEIINSPAFRRLQHIQQMGLAYLSFPTANHRRFEHSIGAMHVASNLYDILIEIMEHLKIDGAVGPPPLTGRTTRGAPT
jgi:HD superfamily phosphohydrolase